MITVCPNCGFSLNQYLKDGLTLCNNCESVIESSVYNQLLSAGWIVRRQNLPPQNLVSWLGLSESHADLVYNAIEVENLSHDEFIKLLKRMKISQKSYID